MPRVIVSPFPRHGGGRRGRGNAFLRNRFGPPAAILRINNIDTVSQTTWQFKDIWRQFQIHTMSVFFWGPYSCTCNKYCLQLYKGSEKRWLTNSEFLLFIFRYYSRHRAMPLACRHPAVGIPEYQTNAVRPIALLTHHTRIHLLHTKHHRHQTDHERGIARTEFMNMLDISKVYTLKY